MTKMQDLKSKQRGPKGWRVAYSTLVTVERLLAFAADCRKQLGVLSEPKKAQSSLPQ